MLALTKTTIHLMTLITVMATLSSGATAQTYRGRQLRSGDQAPNFKLKTLDGAQEFDLADFNKPVVLFFGSYS